MPVASSKRTRLAASSTCTGVLQRSREDDDGVATLHVGDDLQLMLPALLVDGLASEHVTAAWTVVDGDDDAGTDVAVAEAPADGLRLLGIVYRTDASHALISCGGIIARVPVHGLLPCGAHVRLDVMPTKRPRSRASRHAIAPVDAI